MSDTDDGKKDYYTSTGRKIADFLLGFIVAPIIPLFIAFGVKSGSGIGLAILLMVFGTIFAFLKNRRFLAIGMLCACLVPLLLFGACLLMLTQMKF